MSDAARSEPDTSSAAPLEVKEGTLIGRYRVVRELGKGGMGATYVAKRETSRSARASRSSAQTSRPAPSTAIAF